MGRFLRSWCAICMVLGLTVAGFGCTVSDDDLGKAVEPPAAFDLTYPPDGSENVVRDPLFMWEPAPGADFYRFKISRSADMQEEVPGWGPGIFTPDTWFDPHGWDPANQGDFEHFLQYGTIYFWRVEAYNEGGRVLSRDTFMVKTLSEGAIEFSQHPVSHSIAPGGEVNLMVTLDTELDPVEDVTYAWQRLSGSSWIAVGNDEPTLTVADQVGGADRTWYRCVVTATGDGSSVISNPALVYLSE